MLYGKGGSGGSSRATQSRGGILSRASSAVRRGLGRLLGRR